MKEAKRRRRVVFHEAVKDAGSVEQSGGDEAQHLERKVVDGAIVGFGRVLERVRREDRRERVDV